MSKEKKEQKSVVSERIKSLIESKGLTQKEAAEQAGVSQQTIAKWVSGATPNALNLSNFAQANHVPLSSFFETIELRPVKYPPGFITLGMGFESNSSLKKPIDIVSASVNLPELKPLLPTLLERLKKATEQRGEKTLLADFLGVPLASVSQWLSGDREPGGETTLQLLHWVEQQERQK